MRKSKFAPVYLTLVLIALYLPIVVVVLYSFNANTSRFTFDFTGFSLQHYAGLLKDTMGLVARAEKQPHPGRIQPAAFRGAGHAGRGGHSQALLPRDERGANAGDFAHHGAGNHFGHGVSGRVHVSRFAHGH